MVLGRDPNQPMDTVAQREKEGDEKNNSTYNSEGGVDLVEGAKFAAGVVAGIPTGPAKSISRRAGVAFALPELADRMNANSVMTEFENYVALEEGRDLSLGQRNNYNALNRLDQKRHVEGMEPDMPEEYKKLGHPNLGIYSSKNEDGTTRYGNSSFKESPVYKKAPQFWDMYKELSQSNLGEVSRSMGVDETELRQKVNSYQTYMSEYASIEEQLQAKAYPVDGAYLRDFEGYVQQWEEMDKKAGVIGGLGNWWDDVKAMGEGTYMLVTSLAGMVEQPEGKSSFGGGMEMGESFTIGMAGSLTAALSKDIESGERRIYRKPMILLGVIGPGVFGLAKAFAKGALPANAMQKVSAAIKADPRFAAAMEKAAKVQGITPEPILKVARGTRDAAKFVGQKISDFGDADASLFGVKSWIRKDDGAGLPGSRGVEGKVGDFAPDGVTGKAARSPDQDVAGAYKNRTVKDIVKGSLKDAGYWMWTGLPITNPAGFAVTVATSALARAGYGAAIKNVPLFNKAHMLMRQHLTTAGKLSRTSNIDERLIAQKKRDFAELAASELGPELGAALIDAMQDPDVRAVAPDEIAARNIPVTAREVEGRAQAGSATLDKDVKSEFSDRAPDERLLRDRKAVTEEAPAAERKPGTKITYERGVSPELKAAKEKHQVLTSWVQELEQLVQGIERGPRRVYPKGMKRPIDRKQKRLDQFGITEAKKRREKFQSKDDRVEYAIDLVKAKEDLAKAKAELDSATKANKERTKTSEVESPIDDYEVARPEISEEVVTVGDEKIRAVSKERAKEIESIERVDAIKRSAQRAREKQTPDAVAEQLRAEGLEPTPDAIKRAVAAHKRAIDDAEKVLLEKAGVRGEEALTWKEKIAEEDVSDAPDFDFDDWDASPAEQRVSVAASWIALLDEAADQFDGLMVIGPRVIERVKLLEKRFGKDRVAVAMSKGKGDTFTPNGDLIIGSPLYELATGRRMFRPGKRFDREASPITPKVESETRRGRKEAATERVGSEGASVSFLDESTGEWQREFIPVEDFGRKADVKAEVNVDQIIKSKNLRDKTPGQLIRMARLRGLEIPEGPRPRKQPTLGAPRGGFAPGDAMSPQALKDTLVKRIARDIAKDDVGVTASPGRKPQAPRKLKKGAAKEKIAEHKVLRAKYEKDLTAYNKRKAAPPEAGFPGSRLGRRLGEMDAKAVKAFADENKINLKGVRKKADRIEKIQQELYSRALKEMDDADITKGQPVDRSLPARPEQGYDPKQPARAAKTLEESKKLGQARESIVNLNDRQVLEELGRRDPEARAKYDLRNKKKLRDGYEENAPAVKIDKEGPEKQFEAGSKVKIPPAREALARAIAADKNPTAPTYKFKGSTQAAEAARLITKLESAIKKRKRKSEKDGEIYVEGKREQTIRMLESYIEREGGAKKSFNAQSLNKNLKELGEDVQLDVFEKPKKKTATPEPTKDQVRSEAAADSGKADGVRAKQKAEAETLTVAVNKKIAELVDALQARQSGRAGKLRMDLQTLYGKVARAKIPLKDKQPLYLKILEQIGDDLKRPFSPKFKAGEVTVKVGDQTVSRNLTGVQKELLALYAGEVIPEIMAKNKGTFQKVMGFFKGKKGLFNRLNSEVNRLKKADPKKYAQAADDQVAILNEYLGDLDKKPGTNVTGAQARDASMAILKIDDTYYLDDAYYTQKGTEYYGLKNINDAQNGPFLEGPSISESIEIAVKLSDQRRARNVLVDEIKNVQIRNSKIVGTREFNATRAALSISDSTAQIPAGTSKAFVAEINRVKVMQRNRAKFDFNTEVKRLSDSDLSPSEKFALKGELDKIKQTQDSSGPGISKQSGEKPLTKEELAYINSPVTLPEEFIMNAGTGKVKTSERYVVRLVKPWSKAFDDSFRDHLGKLKRAGKSVAERDALVANVMEIFNQGNALLMSDGLKSLVADMAVEKVMARLQRPEYDVVTTLFDQNKRDKLRDNIMEWLGKYDLPFSALPKAADYSKRSVESARVLGEIPTKFSYLVEGGDNIVGATVVPIDLLELVPEAWGKLNDKEKQLVLLDGVRNLTGKLSSQAKFLSLNNVHESEMRRFGISYSDSALSAAAKLAYYNVFAKDANPMALPRVLSREATKQVVDADGKKSTSSTLEAYHVTEKDITGAMTEDIKGFVDALQDVHRQDLREQLSTRYGRKADELNSNLEAIVDEVNKKEGTDFEYSLSDDFLEKAFGKQYKDSWTPMSGSQMDLFKDRIDAFGSIRSQAEKGRGRALSGQRRLSNLNKELAEVSSPFIEMFSELDAQGNRKMNAPDDAAVSSAPQELRPGQILETALNPEFLDVVAWDAQIARDMASTMGRASSLVKAGLTVKSAITQLGNIVGNALGISATTGEGLLAVAARVAESDVLFYMYEKNKQKFRDYTKKNDIGSDVVRAIQAIDRFTAIDLMDGINVEIGVRTQRAIDAKFVGKKDFKSLVGKGLRGASKAVMMDVDIPIPLTKGKSFNLTKAQEYMYKKGDASPRRAEVMREFLEGLEMIKDLPDGKGISFKVSRKGYTTLYKDNQGIYRINKRGGKIRPSKADPFVDKILASYAVRKVSGRVFNYRDVPRIVEMIRSGNLGAPASLFFSPFISFPYLAADFVGKKGILSSTFFEPFFDDSVITNSNRIIASRAMVQSLRGARRGMLMTWAQSQRHPNSTELVEDGKFRRDANTFGAVLPSASQRPGRYKYFSWSNANGFETSFSLLDWAMATQAKIARFAMRNVLKMSDEEIKEETTPLMKQMLARVNAKEAGTVKQLSEAFTFGGNLFVGMIQDYNAKGVPTGLVGQRLAAAFMGKDQSRIHLSLLTRADVIKPTNPVSPYYGKVRADLENNLGAAEQWMSLPKEAKKKFLSENFWPVVSRLQFREKPILKSVTSAGGKKRFSNDAVEYFRKGLEEELLGDIEQKIGKLPKTAKIEASQLKTKLYDVVDNAEYKRLRYVQRELSKEIDAIVKDMIALYQGIKTEEKIRQQYMSVPKGPSTEISYPYFTRERRKTLSARETMREARSKAAGLKMRKQAIEKEAKAKQEKGKL